ncbi:signal peptidase I [Candidatus Enterococcus ferrettii]|uniref:Signal peptidase I n=1 Tax=Candidatus Enterococcus ferrettii TaxID=2815324 RepID=A0ABV0EM01_9ENTE|nr:signal peptidase I [Enterococcus sp. 665A]MBO1343119.1 signal peptidase I [Enterococcus sp. 665A]
MSRRSRQHSQIDARKKRKLIKVVAMLYLLVVGATSFFLIDAQLRKHFSIHWVSGTSMEQNLHDGDAVLVRKQRTIRRYEVIVFNVPKEPDMFVKRVVGMPGDTILIKNNRMILNIGEPENFETIYTFQMNPAAAKTMQPLTKIPEDCYFVIGDHVDVSKDSRSFGLVRQTEIEGIVQWQLAAIN